MRGPVYGAGVRVLVGRLVWADWRAGWRVWRGRVWVDGRRRPGHPWARRLDVGLLLFWFTVDTQ